jgi:hypothetical protein
MSRFMVPASFLRGVISKAVAKRYGATLEEFLFAAENGFAETKYPGSDDLVELSKRL